MHWHWNKRESGVIPIMAKWHGKQFRIWKYTFPIDAIMLVVEFSQNYINQWKLRLKTNITPREGQHNGQYHIHAWAR